MGREVTGPKQRIAKEKGGTNGQSKRRPSHGLLGRGMGNISAGQDDRGLLGRGQDARRAAAAGAGRGAEGTMAVNRSGAAFYAIGRDVYRMPEAAGAKSGDGGGSQAGGWRAARCVHNAAGQFGEGEPSAAMRVSQKRRAALPGPEGARTEVLLHAPGAGGGASDKVQPAGAGRCELNPGGAYKNSARAGGWHTGRKSGHKAGLRSTSGDEQRGQGEF